VITHFYIRQIKVTDHRRNCIS